MFLIVVIGTVMFSVGKLMVVGSVTNTVVSITVLSTSSDVAVPEFNEVLKTTPIMDKDTISIEAAMIMRILLILMLFCLFFE